MATVAHAQYRISTQSAKTWSICHKFTFCIKPATEISNLRLSIGREVRIWPILRISLT